MRGISIKACLPLLPARAQVRGARLKMANRYSQLTHFSEHAVHCRLPHPPLSRSSRGWWPFSICGRSSFILHRLMLLRTNCFLLWSLTSTRKASRRFALRCLARESALRLLGIRLTHHACLRSLNTAATCQCASGSMTEQKQRLNPIINISKKPARRT